MKILNLAVVCSSLFIVACNGSNESIKETSPINGSLNGRHVHTKLYFEYLRRSDAIPIQLNDEQDFIFREKADIEMIKRRFAVVTSYNPNESRPVGIGITNVWAALKNNKTPRVDLNFFFKTKKIETGKIIECTAKESSECLFDVSTANSKMDTPTAKVVCLLKIESEVSLDFSGMEPRPMWRGISFPSSLDMDPLAGKSFSVSVFCTADSKEIINGYFQHNSSVIPNF